MSTSGESIKVIVRCRPFSKREAEQGFKKCVQIDTSTSSILITPPAQATNSNKGDKPSAVKVSDSKRFTFDGAFDETTSQKTIYLASAQLLVESVLQGWNATILAYGQTGTGKTYSMQGIKSHSEELGIIPRTFEQIFNQVAANDHEKQFLIRCTYLEIYNEEIRDLLSKDQSKRLEIKENTDGTVFVKDLSTYVVKTVHELEAFMNSGNDNRQVGATLMNAESSRSHSIFTIIIEACSKASQTSERIQNGKPRVNDVNGSITVGKLHLVDLAGSERQGKTGASGARLKEATKINLSLSALGNCISALIDPKSTHVPYRDSKLTRLLQDSLGGNSKTLMIATLSPADYNFDETLSTLRYAHRTKNIKNKPVINEDPKDAMLKEYQQEIQRLKILLEQKANIPNGSGTTKVKKSAKKTEAEMVGGNEDDDQNSNEYKKSLTELNFDLELDLLSDEISKEQTALAEDTSLLEVEKSKVAQDLAAKLQEIEREREEQKQVEGRLKALEARLLEGGGSATLEERLKAQEFELIEKEKALEIQRQAEETLKNQLKQKQVLANQLTQTFTSLQDEYDQKTTFHRGLLAQYNENKVKLQEAVEESREEREDIMNQAREATREVELYSKILHQFVAKAELLQLHSLARWSNEAQGWCLINDAGDTSIIRRPVTDQSFARPTTMMSKKNLFSKQYGETPNKYKNGLRSGLEQQALKRSITN